MTPCPACSSPLPLHYDGEDTTCPGCFTPLVAVGGAWVRDEAIAPEHVIEVERCES